MRTDDIAYADTHYYGGIKKYQWVARAMALHGVVAKKDGTLVNIVVGEDENDPVVGISDLLIHLCRRPDEQEGFRGGRRRGPGHASCAASPLQGDEKGAGQGACCSSSSRRRYDIEEERHALRRD